MRLVKKFKSAISKIKPTDVERAGIKIDRFAWLLSRRPIGIPRVDVTTRGLEGSDQALVSRVMLAYMEANKQYRGKSNIWDSYISGLNKPIHEALSSGNLEAATNVLRHPKQNTHFWGFDSIATAPPGMTEPHERILRMHNKRAHLRSMLGLWIYDALLSLADAVGARNVSYPAPRKFDQEFEDVDSILDAIEERLGRFVLFLNPYVGEEGLASRRGIISYRAVQSLYQAWRIRELTAGVENPRILEVGAGLGRTAGFAWQLGLQNYAIIDIPLTNAAQGYFLGRTVGEANVKLHAEELARRGVHIIPAGNLELIDGDFDLIVNIDSLTEMSRETAQEYYEFAKQRSTRLFSVNHEFNPFSVRSLYEEDRGVKLLRYPYWLRNGYVEEILTFR